MANFDVRNRIGDRSLILLVIGGYVGVAVVVDESDQLRVQRKVPVLAELADRDM